MKLLEKMLSWFRGYSIKEDWTKEEASIIRSLKEDSKTHSYSVSSRGGLSKTKKPTSLPPQTEEEAKIMEILRENEPNYDVLQKAFCEKIRNSREKIDQSVAVDWDEIAMRRQKEYSKMLDKEHEAAKKKAGPSPKLKRPIGNNYSAKKRKSK